MKGYLEFPDDQVVVDFDEIVYVQALRADQKARSQSAYNTYINLRHGGPVYLTTPYEDVVSTIANVVLGVDRG